jgi:flagellar biosynthesis repressor protein FlbT
MKKSMHLGLKAGERFYINGAVLRVDRKVNIELLNDVKFLLEAHVLQPDETTTPLRQLYFTVQMILMDSDNAETAGIMFRALFASMQSTFENETILVGLRTASSQVENGRLFDALKTLRALFPLEECIVGPHVPTKFIGQSRSPAAA